MKNIIFIAPPAAGKGTISDYLISEFNYHHLSTGELFRQEINNHTKLGDLVSEIIARGDLVDDKIINELVYNAIKSVEKPFILDGYPRNLLQAEYLEQIFKELNIVDYFILNLQISEEALIKRMQGRVTCPKCNRVYNNSLPSLTPSVPNTCDDCHELLVTRDDDNITSFQNRYRIFTKESTDILKIYNELGKVRIINTDTSLEEIYKEVKNILSEEK